MRAANAHFCEAMREEIRHEQNMIAAEYQNATSPRHREWLREQLEASDRAFRRLRIREERERLNGAAITAVP